MVGNEAPVIEESNFQSSFLCPPDQNQASAIIANNTTCADDKQDSDTTVFDIHKILSDRQNESLNSSQPMA